jgi:hypothetical protein
VRVLVGSIVPTNELPSSFRDPTVEPTAVPSEEPSELPSLHPSEEPTALPEEVDTVQGNHFEEARISNSFKTPLMAATIRL